MTIRLAAALLVLLALPAGAARGPQDRVERAALELVVCGWDEVFILAFDEGTEAKPRRLWTWRAKGRPDLPPAFHGLFNSTDDCKPFDGGSKILITSSGGAVALVDRALDKVLFYGRAPNAHSADLLPGGRIAVAASHHRTDEGDRLIVFGQSKPDRELTSEELPWGHGVIWDEGRRVLWALADQDIRVFGLREWGSSAPELQRVALVPLPEAGGHDFTEVPGTPYIALSTANRAWLFDRQSRQFTPHTELGGTARVKSISHHPSGRLAYVQAEGANWWAERIHFLNPPATLHVPGEHFYKARWNPAAKQKSK